MTEQLMLTASVCDRCGRIFQRKKPKDASDASDDEETLCPECLYANELGSTQLTPLDDDDADSDEDDDDDLEFNNDYDFDGNGEIVDDDFDDDFDDEDDDLDDDW